MSLEVRIYGLKTSWCVDNKSHSEYSRHRIYLSDLNPKLPPCAVLLEIASQNVKLVLLAAMHKCKGWQMFLGYWSFFDHRQVRLVVMTPEVRILGDPDIHVKEGSKVNIECVISNTTDHVPYVTWLFNDQVKTYWRPKYLWFESNDWGKNVSNPVSVLNDKYILSQNL